MRIDFKKFKVYWLPVLLWAVIIFLFSSFPVHKTSEMYWQDFIVKKTAHIIEYLTLSTLIYRGFVNSGVGKTKAGYLAILVSVAYAISDEFHQSFTPGREPTIRDVIFDTIGAALAVYTLWKLLPKTQGKLKNLAKLLQVI